MADLVEQSANHVRSRWRESPRFAMILGTGLANAAGQIEVECVLPFDQIPHFTRSTALSHRGRLLCGRMKGIPIVAMEGRCHRYEGYGLDEITLPVRMMAELGATTLIVSNASGGLNPQFRSGQIMVITDHIDLTGHRGGVFAFSNKRPPSMPVSSSGQLQTAWCYDPELAREALAVARQHSIVASPGVYVALTGPNYETRAEYRFLRRIGGDAVGMSTVPEVIAAAERRMRVLALSIVTNLASPDAPRTTDPREVVELAASAEPNLSAIVSHIVT